MSLKFQTSLSCRTRGGTFRRKGTCCAAVATGSSVGPSVGSGLDVTTGSSFVGPSVGSGLAVTTGSSVGPSVGSGLSVTTGSSCRTFCWFRTFCYYRLFRRAYCWFRTCCYYRLFRRTFCWFPGLAVATGSSVGPSVGSGRINSSSRFQVPLSASGPAVGPPGGIETINIGLYTASSDTIIVNALNPSVNPAKIIFRNCQLFQFLDYMCTVQRSASFRSHLQLRLHSIPSLRVRVVDASFP